ncbi:hypothetical protein EWH70_04210 [Amycolatopsis suaedae]|uniref:DUF2637 domain-containing protein n=1 Tax=Amycolatopsis suaedae TaxID=2510978 RepID=A0A4Q7JE11_9PSEU|nr:hypothetical protein EWH70_04210 [Amycolatopsis suaedae]
MERVRRQVERLCWTGILLGLAFTAANVQRFAAEGAAAWSLPWLTAWVLDPTVSLVLVAILRAEQVTARYRVRTGRSVRLAKWLTLSATYVMNTWESWVAGSPAGVVLHSVPPLVVFAAVEAITDLRDKLTEAVTRAAVITTSAVTAVAVHEPCPAPVNADADADVDADAAGAPGARRKLFADYLADARRAWTPGVEVTPAWVREVTSCSRGLSSRLARTLAEELATTGEGVRR